MKVYLASSARNNNFRYVKTQLEKAGHSVHDWTAGPASYGWGEVGIGDPDACSTEQMIAASSTETLQAGLRADVDAINRADVFVLLLPCGADAHFELGYAHRAGKTCLILTLNGFMRASQFYAVAGMTGDVFGDVKDLVKALETL